MRYIIITVLLACLCQVFVSGQEFPAASVQRWRNYTFTITSDDCEKAQKTFPKCDDIFGDLKGPDFIVATINFLVNELKNISNHVLVRADLNLFCKAVNTYKDCIIEGGKQCSKGKSWIRFYNALVKKNPVYTFTKDLCTNSELKPEYNSASDWESLNTCLSGSDNLRKVIDSLTQALNSVKRAGDTLERDPDLPDTANNKKQMKVLCSLMADVKRKLFSASKKCTDQARRLLLKLTQLIMPPDIDGKCTMPSDENSDYARTYKSNDDRRTTVFIFGGFHKLLANTTTVDTCSYTDGENVTLFQIDKLVISSTAAVLSNGFTYMKTMKISFNNDDEDNIDTLTAANCLMPSSFDINGGTVLDENSKKGKGTFKSKITLTIVNENKVRINDQSSGALITILRFKSGDKCIYSVIFRLPQAAFDISSGGMNIECMTSVDLSGSKKRDTAVDTSKQANYDSTKLNDPNAKSMATDTQAEVSYSVTADKSSNVIKGSGLVTCLIVAMYAVLIL